MKLLFTLSFYFISILIFGSDTLAVNVFYKNIQLVKKGEIIHVDKKIRIVLKDQNQTDWFIHKSQDSFMLFSVKIKNKVYEFSLNNKVDYDSMNIYIKEHKFSNISTKKSSIKFKIFMFIANNFYNLGISYTCDAFFNNKDVISVSKSGTKLNRNKVLGNLIIYKEDYGSILW